MQQAESKFGLLTTQSNIPNPNCNSNFYNNTRGLEGVLGAVPDDCNRENALKTPPLDVEERSKQPACNISLCYESAIQRECKVSQQNESAAKVFLEIIFAWLLGNARAILVSIVTECYAPGGTVMV